MTLALILALVAGDPPSNLASGLSACPTCAATPASIRRLLADLHAAKWRDRDRAARALGEVRWECHPEVVVALAQTLRDDGKSKVRAEAAETLAHLIPNLPTSHVALVAAARDDPEPSVRKQAAKALAANGRRCIADCPICGPLPTGAAITGPTITLPELIERPGPVRPEPQTPASSPALPPALPNGSIRSALEDAAADRSGVAGDLVGEDA